MKLDRRDEQGASAAAPAAAAALDPNRLAVATDAEFAALFREVSTLPLDALMNDGGHKVDLATRTIFNDEHWKGWLPKGLALRDIFARLSTGYAKRFWKQGNRYLGETLYLDGRIRVKHSLEELTIDRPTNDLDPGRYILLRYTDPVFEHLFYDVMKAANDGVIVYGGYTGRFPEGKRGFTSVLMRRYSFPQLGVRDHQVLVRKGTRPAKDALSGVWRVDVVTTSNHATPVARVSFVRMTGGVGIQCEPVAEPVVLVPSFLVEHFTANDTSKLERELRSLDDRMMVGTWNTEIKGLYARFVSATPGLFHRDAEKGSGRYTMRYMLTRVE
jgi:hypothetical protein